MKNIGASKVDLMKNLNSKCNRKIYHITKYFIIIITKTFYYSLNRDITLIC